MYDLEVGGEFGGEKLLKLRKKLKVWNEGLKDSPLKDSKWNNHTYHILRNNVLYAAVQDKLDALNALVDEMRRSKEAAIKEAAIDALVDDILQKWIVRETEAIR